MALCTGSLLIFFFLSLRWNDWRSALRMVNTKTITPCLKAWKGLESFKGDFSARAFQVYQHSDTYIFFNYFQISILWHIIRKLIICTFTICKKLRNDPGWQRCPFSPQRVTNVDVIVWYKMFGAELVTVKYNGAWLFAQKLTVSLDSLVCWCGCTCFLLNTPRLQSLTSVAQKSVTYRKLWHGASCINVAYTFPLSLRTKSFVCSQKGSVHCDKQPSANGKKHKSK